MAPTRGWSKQNSPPPPAYAAVAKIFPPVILTAVARAAEPCKKRTQDARFGASNTLGLISARRPKYEVSHRAGDGSQQSAGFASNLKRRSFGTVDDLLDIDMCEASSPLHNSTITMTIDIRRRRRLHNGRFDLWEWDPSCGWRDLFGIAVLPRDAHAQTVGGSAHAPSRYSCSNQRAQSSHITCNSYQKGQNPSCFSFFYFGFGL